MYVCMYVRRYVCMYACMFQHSMHTLALCTNYMCYTNVKSYIKPLTMYKTTLKKYARLVEAGVRSILDSFLHCNCGKPAVVRPIHAKCAQGAEPTSCIACVHLSGQLPTPARILRGEGRTHGRCMSPEKPWFARGASRAQGSGHGS